MRLSEKSSAVASALDGWWIPYGSGRRESDFVDCQRLVPVLVLGILKANVASFVYTNSICPFFTHIRLRQVQNSQCVEEVELLCRPASALMLASFTAGTSPALLPTTQRHSEAILSSGEITGFVNRRS